MRNSVKVILLLLALCATVTAQTGGASPLGNSKQIVVVTTSGWDAVDGRLLRFERVRSGWKQVGGPIAIVVGEKGLGWGKGLHPEPGGAGPIKREGDGKSPAGVFPISQLFGYSSQRLARTTLPYLTLTDTIECVDDVKSTHYNQLVDRAKVKVDWNSSEKMRAESLYKWGAVAAHNASPIQAGGGSCIFLHTWRRPGSGTAGCTAMTEDHLVEVLQWLQAKKHPLLVQLPQEEYERLKTSWKLP